MENMVENAEGVRLALNRGKISLLGHSYNGALASSRTLKYQPRVKHLILAATWSSSKAMNEVFAGMENNMTPGENTVSWSLTAT
jgi:pimeloyl-ACP methyl ester carboxylesterase